MDSVLLETPMEGQSPTFDPPSVPNCETMLQESIDRFLIEIKRGSCDFLSFRSIFFRRLQSSIDPPLEIIWFYAATTYHEILPSKKSPLDRVMAVRDLLQLLTVCSASSGGLKCIALLAPALSELYKCFMEAKELEDQKKVRKEIESLVEGILSHISICSSKRPNEHDSSVELLSCFTDLVRVWAMQLPSSGDSLRIMFPLVSDEIRDGFWKEKCDIGYLAGVVIAEAFLLRLCLKVLAGGAVKPELQKELKIWAVSSVTVFGNRAFFESLVRLLLDPTLPIISIMNPKDEIIMRGILYDAVILVDYSFLNSGMEVEQSCSQLKSLALTRLMITHEAIRIARSNGDHGKAISYTNAFSTSSLPSGIVKWIANQIGNERLNKPNATTPQAILKWLVGLEKKKMSIFDGDLSKLRKNLILDVASEDSAGEGTGDHIFIDKRGEDVDNLFFDKQGEEEAKDVEMESADSLFLAAAQSMKLPASNEIKKRKERRDEEGKTQNKSVKVHNGSVKNYFSPCVSSGSEVEDPPPSEDADMEETEQ